MRTFDLSVILCVLFAASLTAQPTGFDMTLRSRSIDDEGRLMVTHKEQAWDATRTAIIVCDMWDAHHCLNAVQRVGEMAPTMNRFLIESRKRGATIIHAPSSCMDFYKDHPARKHVGAIPHTKNPPIDIESWCHWINPTEENSDYPIDQSDGGEDDDPDEHTRWAAQLKARGRNPGSPWIRQVESIEIDDTDFITDDGVENWSILEHRDIDNVMLVGVHTNMCVLGRPFGLRQLAKNGKNVVLVRDLTDTMYNPLMRPYVSHFSGTDLIVEHIERYVCPTVTSNQVLGGDELRFRHDDRPHIVMLIGEQEYESASTLPAFAKAHLYQDMKVSYVVADQNDIHHFPGLEVVKDADLLLISVRRRTPPTEQLDILREYVASGRPVVAIRTASHAFSLRDNEPPPPGHAAWPAFDADVLGGNYQGHHGNKHANGDPPSMIWSEGDDQPLNQWPGLSSHQVRTTSWLYKTSPLRPGTIVLQWGRVGDRKPDEPVTWTYIHSGGGRTFYTSLGHPDDFETAAFQQLLKAGIGWAIEGRGTRD